MATATETTAILHTGMAELACKPQVPVMLTPLGEEAAANAHAQTHDDEVLHAVGQAESMFAQG